MEKNNFRILIIDDNPAIHLDFIKILKTNSETSKLDDLSDRLFGKETVDYLPEFEIDIASQGEEGVNIIKKSLKEGKHYSLAFVDIRMPPGWDGIETIKHIWKVDKDIQIVICTAFSDYSWEETIEHLGKRDNLLILKKPFDNISVRQLACALTTKWQLANESRQHTMQLQQQIADRTLSLEESLALVKSTFESSSDGILVINLENEIVEYNKKFVQMLEVPDTILQLKSEEKLFHYLENKLINADEFFSRLRELQNDQGETSADILKLNNGKVLECYTQPHKLNNKIIGRILAFRDITKRAELEKNLEYQATHDSLTGLANRVKLLEKIKYAIKTSSENKIKFAVLFLDFDRFKLVNDSLSHLSGDALLQSAANRLQMMIRSEDVLARLGGDEFVVLLMNLEKEEYVKEKVLKLLSVFDEPFDIEDRKVTLTVSIGISFFPKDATTVEGLLRNADAAMYKAKAHKGNDFQFYTPEMSEQSLAALDKESELRQAITHNEFFLTYQPQIDIATEKLVAVEALIRWKHPTKGILLPLDFVELAEETGLIVPIGEWILRTACHQNKAWQIAGLPPIRIAVNVTSQQFKQPNLVKIVKNILEESQLKPEYLELELTENLIISNRETLRVVSELKELGVSITIDDFGTGYSSLSYLHKIPLDRLKIDSSFVKNIQTATGDKVIIKAVIAMAKGLNLNVVAEGVENKDQLNFLKQHACGDAQGFYFSKPLDSDELQKLLKNPIEIKKILPTADK